MTPEPRDCCTRWRNSGEAPKKRWNKGSAKSGLTCVCTTDARIDVHDRRRHALDDGRESELHLLHRLRHLLCGESGCGEEQA